MDRGSVLLVPHSSTFLSDAVGQTPDHHPVRVSYVGAEKDEPHRGEQGRRSPATITLWGLQAAWTGGRFPWLGMFMLQELNAMILHSFTGP